MNSNNFFESVQQGFRVAVGATASLVETIQNPQKRDEAWSELSTQLNERTQEWAEKGKLTEEEARKVVDNLLQKNTTFSQETTTSTPNASSSTPTPNPEVQSELKELTEQIVALRTELEGLRQSDSN